VLLEHLHVRRQQAAPLVGYRQLPLFLKKKKRKKLLPPLLLYQS
jgi:hypothetical protein